MAVLVWIAEGTWPACVDAARTHLPPDTDIVLLHVSGHDVAGAAHGAFAGLLGRGHPERDPGTPLQHLPATSRSLPTNIDHDLINKCDPNTRTPAVNSHRHSQRLEAGRRAIAEWGANNGALTAEELADGLARARALLGRAIVAPVGIAGRHVRH